MTDRALMDEAALWSYRLILGREPESESAIRHHADRFGSVADMRMAFLHSREFGAFVAAQKAAVPGADILAHFPPWTGEGEPGFWRDFIGVRTRTSFLHDAYAPLSGTVQGTPGTEELPLHHPAEWIGTLRSVVEARSRQMLVVIELGAGWGPWLVDAAVAAKRVGISDVRLAGVEGSWHHFEFMKQHFQDNGLDPGRHALINGAVGAKDGTARFPVLANPRDDWSAEADFAGRNQDFEEVPCIALTTLLSQLPPVDLIHCDVQGAELDVMLAATDTLNARVRRVVIGTHSRKIDCDLMELFAGMGWVLEDEMPCKIKQNPETRAIQLEQDGHQVWSNPARA